MKVIGNIVTTESFTISDRFNLVSSYDEVIPDLPTLIIGFQQIKQVYPDFNIMKHKINDDLYWTFSRKEKKDKFNEIVIQFVDACFHKLVKNIEYIYIDPIHYSEDKLNRISKKLTQLNNPIGIMIDSRKIYIYGDNIIFGFDLDVCEFTGIKRESLINKFSKLVGGFLNQEMILIEYGNDIAALNDSIRYTPFLYSIDNE